MQDMTPEQLEQFIAEFEAGKLAKNPNAAQQPPKTWGLNTLGLPPDLSVWEALISSLRRYGTPVK